MATYSVTFQNPHMAYQQTEDIEADYWTLDGEDFVVFRKRDDERRQVFAVSTSWVGLIRRVENGDSNGKTGDSSA